MNSLIHFLSNSTMLSIGKDIEQWAVGILGSLIWGLCNIFFVIIDLFETLFRKFAGIDPNVTNASGEAIEGDIVLYLIQSNLVQQIFMSILVLSLMLLIIFTIFAIVKNQYAEKQEPVSKIVNSSFKALLMYLFVPVATVVLLMVGNIVLQAIDGGTRALTDGGTASDMLFMSAAYNANRLRDDDPDEARYHLQIMIEEGYLRGYKDVADELEIYGVNLSNPSSAALVADSDLDAIAQIIDDAFTNSRIGGWAVEKWNFGTVHRYYYTHKISFITVWIGGAFLIWAIGSICWGLLARMFRMTLYFAISPAVMATFPIDGGKALGSWRTEMVKNGTMAFCSIGVLNVLYSILPFFNDIRFFGVGGIAGFGSWLMNVVLKLFIYIIAFTSAKELISSISSWFGTGDALAEGAKVKGTVTGELGKYAKKSVATVGAFRGGIKEAKEHGAGFWGALAGGAAGIFSQTSIPGKFKPIAEEWGKGKKAAAEQYKAFRTMDIKQEKRKAKLAEYEEYDNKATLAKQYEGLGSGSYSFRTDDGTDPEQLKRRKFLMGATDAGQAIYEDDIKKQEIEEAKAKQEGEFLGLLEGLSRSTKARDKAEAKVAAEIDELYGAGTWSGTAAADRRDMVSRAIRNAHVTGKNVDILKELTEQWDEATSTAEDTAESIKLSRDADDKFKTFSAAYVVTDRAGNITGLHTATLESDALANKQAVKKLEKKAEALDKAVAAINEQYIQGKPMTMGAIAVAPGVTIAAKADDEKNKKAVADYRKAHPKS